ncbi:MAG: gamma-glutamyl-gamma-aminobutyrate hydrolase family protein [Nostocoides sp.]
MGDRPLIAIPQRFSATTSALRYAAEVTSANLAAAVYACGGNPVSVHPHPLPGRPDAASVAGELAWAHGVLLPGGGDIAAMWSNQPEHPALYDVDLIQDAFDVAMARFAFARQVPMLAICRGNQVVNVALGGTLVQDMDSDPSRPDNHRNYRGVVETKAGTAIATLVGEQVATSCYHHQCLDVLAAGLVATAWSQDGVIEAVERPGSPPWYLGVQWHPEDTWDTDPDQRALFTAFVDASRERVRVHPASS